MRWRLIAAFVGVTIVILALRAMRHPESRWRALSALVLAGEALRKFGGDSLGEFVRNHDGFVASLT